VQHTSVSIRQHTSAYVYICERANKSRAESCCSSVAALLQPRRKFHTKCVAAVLKYWCSGLVSSTELIYLSSQYWCSVAALLQLCLQLCLQLVCSSVAAATAATELHPSRVSIGCTGLVSSIAVSSIEVLLL